MKALVTADLHFTAKARDLYRFDAMETIAGLIEKHKPGLLLILGDLTEEKDYHSAALVNDVVEVISAFAELCEVIILRGNHDYTEADCPFFHFLRRLKRVRWINTVRQMNLGIGDCLFLPHTRDYEKDWEGIHPEQHNWIFAHNTFEGTISEHGKKLNGIPLDVFTEGTPVISGDIHTPQLLEPVEYVGSPYTVDFGDDFVPRVLLIDQDQIIRSIPVLGPQKRLMEITTADIGKFKQFTDLHKGDIIKARCTLLPKEQSDWFAIRDDIKRELLDLGMIVHVVQPKTTAKSNSVVIKRPENKSDERLVEEYGKQVAVPKDTLKVGLELTKEA